MHHRWFISSGTSVHQNQISSSKLNDVLVLQVQPASKLGSRVKAHGGKVAVFNLEPSNHAEDADFLFLGPCEKRLEEVFAI